MANTVQLVQWALEMRCRLRDDEDSVRCPKKAGTSVTSAQVYSEAVRKKEEGFGNYGDVHVTSYTFANRPGDADSDSNPPYPVTGFVISQEFSRVGGTEEMFEMCARCPANVRPHELARCTGTVCQRPNSPDTEQQLRQIIARLGLEDAVADAFPNTTPLWYGLWAVSPVPRRSLGVLKTLIAEMLAEDHAEMLAEGHLDENQITNFSAMVSAIDVAANTGLNLHVQLLPPGHTDFGMYTIFPHCPFCKAAAPVNRWPRQYPTQHHTCEVCGTKFSPAETSSSERMTWDRDELRDILGQERFEEFAKQYLIAHGESPTDAAAIVQEKEADHARRQEKIQETRRLELRRRIYLDEHIYAGLDDLPVSAKHLEEDEDEEEKDDQAVKSSTGWFAADNFTKVLQRCTEKGVRVTMMRHSSCNPAFDRRAMVNHKSPFDILSSWQAAGCNEKFFAVCLVPDSLVT